MLILRFAVLAVGLTTALPASAFEGRYTAGDASYRQQMTIRKRGADRYAVELRVSMRGCIGEVAAIATLRGRNLIVSQADDGEQCELTIAQQGTGAQVEEIFCSPFHGLSCGFSGVYRRR